jgi:hypothetical protein
MGDDDGEGAPDVTALARRIEGHLMFTAQSRDDYLDTFTLEERIMSFRFPGSVA